MDQTLLPPIAPSIVQRTRSKDVLEAALALGYSQLQAGVISGRLGDAAASGLQRTLMPQMADLDAPDSLPDIDRATDRLVRAIVNKESIICATDHDADGVSGHSVVRGALIDIFQHPAELTHSFISHRLKEGYGISEGVVDRINAAGHNSGVLCSVDQGSSDEVRIARLKQMGIDTVVTDHHGVEGAGPPSAFACVNPVREDSRFPDKFIAGCHVAWLTMASVRRELIRIGHLPDDTPHLTEFLPAVALGTTADCVSFARSRNNRLLVKRGLHLINTAPAPCWQALLELTCKGQPATASTLSYSWGAALNARGRVDEAMTGVRFLRAQTLDHAHQLAALMMEANEERKQIERTMRDRAMPMARKQVINGAKGLAIWLDDGHSGVHGVVSSRLVEAFGRPTICISPKQGQPGIVTGSARSVPGFHVREAFARMESMYPGCFIASGGHEGAGGLTARESDIPAIQSLWDDCVAASGIEVGPVVVTDGPLPRAPDFAMLAELAALEPFGREFDAPCFSQSVVVRSARAIGEGGKHMQLDLDVMGSKAGAVWFNVPDLSWRVEEGLRATCVFEVNSNTYRGNTRLQLIVRHMVPGL